MMTTARNLLFEKRVRRVQNWPKPGISFLDLNPYLADPQGLAEVKNLLLAQVFHLLDGNRGPTVIAGLEARGLALAGLVASEAKTGFVAVRKAGKTPPPTEITHSTKEYGEDILEIPALDFLGWNAIIIDDIVATGGTINSAARLLSIRGANVVGAVAITDIPDLNPKFDFPVKYAIPSGSIVWE